MEEELNPVQLVDYISILAFGSPALYSHSSFSLFDISGGFGVVWILDSFYVDVRLDSALPRAASQ